MRAPPSARLGPAYATLERGSLFLAGSLQARAQAGEQSLRGPGGAKVVGNGLRELDRFLSLLLDAAADGILASEFDRSSYARQSNVANKLDLFYRLLGETPPDGRQLRAIGRVRACLHHCRGVVHDPTLWADLRLATGQMMHVEQAGPAERLSVSFVELAQICRFYGRAGADLMAACGERIAVP
jgi:hypothetical protein